MKPKIFICIPVHNRINYTIKCLKSIISQTYTNYHIIVSDAGSTDRTQKTIYEAFPGKVTIVSIDHNNYWAGGINACIRYALDSGEDKDYVLTLNNDTELAPDCLENLISFALNDSKYIVGALNLFYNDRTRIEPSAFFHRKFLFFLYSKRLFSFGQTIPVEAKKSYYVDTLSGKGVLLPLEAFKINGLYAEKQLPHYHADSELIERNRSQKFIPVLLMSAHLYSHVHETGIGTLDRNPITFFLSFFSKKSANHLRSLYYYSRLVYGRRWAFYLLPKILFINAGFVKRFLRPKVHCI